MSLNGWPVTTLVRGHVVMSDGARNVAAGFGAFQPRGTYDLMMPRNEFPTKFDPHL
jgi:dihydropyrimidinase